MTLSPPPSPRSPEDSLRPRAQLRPTFTRRRKTDTEEPNSVEKVTHRRKAPAPMRLGFAGAEARRGSVHPPSPLSPEDSIRPRAQLRPTFSRRRKTDTEEPNSVERGTHRRKAPAPIRVCFAGADARTISVPPTSSRSSEDRLRPRAQLRLEPGNRRKTSPAPPLRREARSSELGGSDRPPSKACAKTN
jgi:hypothetical protein